jgi:peptide deformylase
LRYFGDPVLSLRAVEVVNYDWRLNGLVKGMFAEMYRAGGIGLAAPQIGVSERIFVYDLNGASGVVINPVIIEQSNEGSSHEGCLSVPGYFFDIPRAGRVALRGQDVDGMGIELVGEGRLAEMFQHETDHLDGVLVLDRADAAVAGVAKRALLMERP